LLTSTDVLIKQLRALNADKVDIELLCDSTRKIGLAATRRSIKHQPLIHLLALEEQGVSLSDAKNFLDLFLHHLQPAYLCVPVRHPFSDSLNAGEDLLPVLINDFFNNFLMRLVRLKPLENFGQISGCKVFRDLSQLLDLQFLAPHGRRHYEVLEKGIALIFGGGLHFIERVEKVHI
jgi:hypothetical protein